MKSATTTQATETFQLRGCITPDYTTPWQPPAQPSGLANATPVQTKPRKRGAAVTHG